MTETLTSRWSPGSSLTKTNLPLIIQEQVCPFFWCYYNTAFPLSNSSWEGDNNWHASRVSIRKLLQDWAALTGNPRAKVSLWMLPELKVLRRQPTMRREAAEIAEGSLSLSAQQRVWVKETSSSGTSNLRNKTFIIPVAFLAEFTWDTGLAQERSSCRCRVLDCHHLAPDVHTFTLFLHARKQSDFPIIHIRC